MEWTESGTGKVAAGKEGFFQAQIRQSTSNWKTLQECYSNTRSMNQSKESRLVLSEEWNHEMSQLTTQILHDKLCKAVHLLKDILTF